MPSALNIVTIKNKTFQSNSYIIETDNCQSVIVIDPGEIDAVDILDYLKREKRNVEYLLVTHEHFDHIAGIIKLKKAYDCRIVASRETSLRMTDPKKNFSKYFDGTGFSIPPADIICNENNWFLEWNDISVRCINTPGHSPGSICFIINGLLFSGDTLLKDLKTVIKIPAGNKKALEKSIDKIFELIPQSTKILPGHGEDFLLYNTNKELIL